MTFTFTPPRDDPDEGSYWRGLDDGMIVLQHCTTCDAWQFPPLPGCRSCGPNGHVEFKPVSGLARLYSWTVCHLAFDVAFATEVPFTIGEVELEEGPRMLVRLVDVDSDTLAPDLVLRLGVGGRDGYPIPIASQEELDR